MRIFITTILLIIGFLSSSADDNLSFRNIFISAQLPEVGDLTSEAAKHLSLKLNQL